MTHRYEHGVRFVMKRGALAAGVFGVMLLAMVGLFRTVPSSLAPHGGSGLRVRHRRCCRTRRRSIARPRRSGSVEAEVRNHPAVKNAAGVAGMDPLTQAFKTNGGIIWLPLKPWDERTGDENLSPEGGRQRRVRRGRAR